eukprot:927338_1
MDPDTFDGTTSDSWYIKNECLALDELQPIWFLVLSQSFTTVLAWVMLAVDNAKYYDDDDNTDPQEDDVERTGTIQNSQTKENSQAENKSPKDETSPTEDTSSKKKKSRFSLYVKRLFQWTLKAWSIVSFITITVLDIKHWSEWIDAHHHASGWDHFVCMGCIIVTSSNFKRLLGFAAVVTAFKIQKKGTQPDPISSLLLQVLGIVTSIYSLLATPWWLLIIIPTMAVSCWPFCIFMCCFCCWLGRSDDDGFMD